MKRMGCLGFLVILLLGVVAYDQWQIWQLRSEVESIASKVHAGKNAKAAAGKQSDLVTNLAEAEKYTRQAKELLAGKQVSQAQAKLDKAMHKIKSANGVSKDIVGDTAQFLGKAKDNAVSVFQKAWKDISEEPAPSAKAKAKAGKAVVHTKEIPAKAVKQ